MVHELLYLMVKFYDVCCFRGENPAEADVNLLDTARKVELYGIRMVPAKVKLLSEVPELSILI